MTYFNLTYFSLITFLFSCSIMMNWWFRLKIQELATWYERGFVNYYTIRLLYNYIKICWQTFVVEMIPDVVKTYVRFVFTCKVHTDGLWVRQNEIMFSCTLANNSEFTPFVTKTPSDVAKQSPEYENILWLKAIK